ncbi:WD repeat-containing protein 64-like [Mustelus asterias]
MDHFTDHGLDAPFLLPTFRERLDQFNNLVALIVRTLKAIDSSKKVLDFEPTTYDEFYDTVQDLFHGELKTEYVKAVFKKININLETPIDWCELFGYFPSDDRNIFDILPIFLVSKRQQIELREEEKRRHDHIQSIVKVPQLDQVLAVTLKGVILLYSSQVILEIITELLIQTNFFTIKPMKNIILCICTVILPEYQDEDCMLIGDDAGFLNRILVGTDDLNFQKSTMESNASQSQALDPRLLRRTILRRKLHDGWVLRVKYISHLNCFACCSPDSVHSLVLDDIRKLGDCQPIRTLSIPRGVNAFDYCVKANTIVTGGEDKILRLWNPYMFTKPKALLYGHSCIINEVVINEADQQIISLSTEGMFRVWDVQTLAVLQVFSLGDRKGDRHFNTMIFDRKAKRLITGSNTIDFVPLMSAVQDSMLVPLSHEKSINVLAYNRMNNKLVSICSKSVIMVWELQTGKKIYQIEHPHGHAIEVTAGAIDPSGGQLITGAIDGSVIIWDFYTGEKLKSFVPTPETSEEDNRILQLFFLNYGIPQLILIFGWKNKIKIIQAKLEVGILAILAILGAPQIRFNKDPLLEPSVDVGEQNFLQDVKPAKVEIVKFIPLRTKRTEIEITGITDSLTVMQLLNTVNQGKQLAKILPTIQFSNPITAVCVDDSWTLLIAGNQRGHIIIWDISEFLDDPFLSNKESINRLISWRAHNLQIVNLFHVENVSVVVSASIDCSIRIWYAPNGHYIGYFGQHSTLVLTNSIEFTLPCDITEAPVESKSKKSEKSAQLDYPLMVDWESCLSYWNSYSWKSIFVPGAAPPVGSRSCLSANFSGWAAPSHQRRSNVYHSPTNEAPTLKAEPIENSISGTREMGAVFRALPVYTIDPLFQMNPFENISVSSAEGGKDSLHNFFAGERKGFTNVKKLVSEIGSQTDQQLMVLKDLLSPGFKTVQLEAKLSYILPFDESWNKPVQKKQLAIHARFCTLIGASLSPQTTQQESVPDLQHMPGRKCCSITHVNGSRERNGLHTDLYALPACHDHDTNGRQPIQVMYGIPDSVVLPVSTSGDIGPREEMGGPGIIKK